jgi:hypothetical protein
MVFKKKLLSVLVAVMTIGVMQASIAVPATMAYTNATPSATSAQNQVLINSVMNGESVY